MYGHEPSQWTHVCCGFPESQGSSLILADTHNHSFSMGLVIITVPSYQDVIICGHYDCGGVRAAMRNVSHGNVDLWIMGELLLHVTTPNH